jgi:hypothetical protein
MSDDSTEWRHLKSDWQASAPADGAFWQGVRASLQRRIWLGRLWFAIESVSFLFLAFIVVINLSLSRFAAASGVALIMALCLAGAVWARRVRRVGNLDSLPGMVDLTLSRARHALRIVYASYVVIGVLFVWSIVQGPWPLDERAMGRIVWLALSAGTAVAIQLHTSMRIRRFSELRRSFEGVKS